MHIIARETFPMLMLRRVLLHVSWFTSEFFPTFTELIALVWKMHNLRIFFQADCYSLKSAATFSPVPKKAILRSEDILRTVIIECNSLVIAVLLYREEMSTRACVKINTCTYTTKTTFHYCLFYLSHLNLKKSNHINFIPIRWMMNNNPLLSFPSFHRHYALNFFRAMKLMISSCQHSKEGYRSKTVGKNRRV